MLLEFRTKNYKSFREEMVFSMIPAPISDLDYSLLSKEGKGGKVSALSSSVIYGPNAAGKTNIIGAMDTFKEIVLRGNIQNSQLKSPNAASANLELIPFFKNKEICPTDFAIKFFDGEDLFSYELSCDLGEFTNDTYERKILREELSVNNRVVFSRSDALVTASYETLSEWLNEGLEKRNFNVLRVVASGGLNPQELFLTSGFKSIFSTKLTERVTQWINSKFIVIYNANGVFTRKQLKSDEAETIEVDTVLDEATKIFGSVSNAIGYYRAKENAEPELCSLIENLQNPEQRIAIPAEYFESYGTYRFANELPLIMSAFARGGTLVVDEFDASLHPMALMSIINAFHNDELNTRHAQLIFNTHNPIFLNGNLFRRDEIKFVERDEETDESSVYQLSDFGTQGEHGVRKGGDYMKNYFINRYGAIKNVDFSPVFEKLVQKPKE